MTGIANTKSRRFGYDAESAFETTGAGAYVNPSAYFNVVVNPDREAITRDEEWNSFGDTYAEDPGVQNFDASVSFPFVKQTYADNKRLFSAALGSEDAGGALTADAGTTTQSVVKITAGTPQKVIKVIGNDGVGYMVPVKSFTGGTDANLAMQLPASAIGAGLTASNPSALAGAVFSYLMGTSASTFLLEFDRAGQAGQVKYRGWGAAVKALTLIFDLHKRLGFKADFMASRWEKNGGGGGSSPAYQLADPAVRTHPFISFACNCHLYQTDLASTVSAKVKLKQLSFNLCPELNPETGTKSLDGSNSIFGSDITGYTRMALKDKLKLQLTYPDASWHDRFDPTNPDNQWGLFCEWFTAKPAATPYAPRVVAWFPALQLAAEPKMAEVNNGEAQDLVFNIGRDPATSLPSVILAMTNT